MLVVLLVYTMYMRNQTQHTHLRVLPLLWIFLCGTVIIIGSIRLYHLLHHQPPERPTVTIANNTFSVRVAATPATQALGLSGVRGLAPNEGMYFPFAEEKSATFWMKGMRMSIDLVWIRNGTVIGLEQNMPIPPAGTADAQLRTWTSPEPVDAVLEIPAGTVSRLGIRLGQGVYFSAHPPARK